MAFGITFWKTEQDFFFSLDSPRGQEGVSSMLGAGGVWDGAGLRGRQC